MTDVIVLLHHSQLKSGKPRASRFRLPVLCPPWTLQLGYSDDPGASANNAGPLTSLGRFRNENNNFGQEAARIAGSRGVPRDTLFVRTPISDVTGTRWSHPRRISAEAEPVPRPERSTTRPSRLYGSVQGRALPVPRIFVTPRPSPSAKAKSSGISLERRPRHCEALAAEGGETSSVMRRAENLN